MEASLCQEGGMGDRLDKGLFGRETVRQWDGLGCERRRRQALGSGLVDRAPAAPGAGTGSGEVDSPPGEEGWTLETLGGQGLLVYGWPAPGKTPSINNISGYQGRKVETHEALLMAKPVESGVLEVFDVDRRYLVNRRVPLLPQAREVGIKLLAICLIDDVLYGCHYLGRYSSSLRSDSHSSRLPGTCSGNPSLMFNLEISILSLFLCAGFWIPMAVRSSGVIREMVGMS